jgi:hypothetical protein
MLPFLKKNHEGSASAPIESVERKSDNEDDEYDSLESAAEDLCNAIHSKDYKAVAAAWRAGNELLETQPHEEGPHI